METNYQISLRNENSFVVPVIPGIPQIFTWDYTQHPVRKLQHRLLQTSIVERKCEQENRPWTWIELLTLWGDGTGLPDMKYKEQWIYLTGTPPGYTDDALSAFQHKFKRHECYRDPEYIALMYRNAFKEVTKRWIGMDGRFNGPEHTLFRWADCDISPMICGRFGLSGNNILIHMEITDECDIGVTDTGDEVKRCQVIWRWMGLPLLILPWSRQIRVALDGGGSTVVPAFPSAEEQLWSLMSQPGAQDGISYWPNFTHVAAAFADDGEEQRELDDAPPWGHWNTITVVQPQPDMSIAVFPGGSWDFWGEAIPFNAWGKFQAFLDMRWDFLEPETKTWINCNAESWLDRILQWWDNAYDVVHPRNCTNEAEAEEWYREDQRKSWKEFMEDIEARLAQ